MLQTHWQRSATGDSALAPKDSRLALAARSTAAHEDHTNGKEDVHATPAGIAASPEDVESSYFARRLHVIHQYQDVLVVAVFVFSFACFRSMRKKSGAQVPPLPSGQPMSEVQAREVADADVPARDAHLDVAEHAGFRAAPEVGDANFGY